MTCLLTQNLIPTDCQDVPQGGLTGNVWIGNFSDLKNSTLTLGSDGEITDIVPLAGGVTLLFRIVGTPGSVIPSTPFVRNDVGVSGVQHVLSFLVADNSMAMKNSLASLYNFNKAFAIVETDDFVSGSSADSKAPAYVMYGIERGLNITNQEGALNDPAMGGAQQITLTSAHGVELNQPTNVILTQTAIIALESAAA